MSTGEPRFVLLPEHLINQSGRVVWTGLVLSQPDGCLQVLIPVPAGPGGADDGEEWAVETFRSEEAKAFSAELASYEARIIGGHA